MAAFPTSPTNGQQVTLNGITYTYNSTKTAWVRNSTASGTASAVSAAGTDTQVQFNDSGIFGGDPGLTYNKTTDQLTVGGPISINSTNQATAIINAGSAGGGNIGASGAGFNTVFAKATSAEYADLAELYLADLKYAPGTVVEFGGVNEITISSTDMSQQVAGVISTNPAHVMNDSLTGEYVVELALYGRVPCLVQGLVRKGDMMVSAGNGRARAEANPKIGSVIGKALENTDLEYSTIEILVGRN